MAQAKDSPVTKIETNEEKPLDPPEKKEPVSLEERFFVKATPAQETFARKPTAAELKTKSMMIEVLEKAWWIIVILLVLLLLWANIDRFRSLLDFLFEKPVATPTPQVEVMQELQSQVVSPVMTGVVAKVQEDLGLVNRQFFPTINYYRAGKFVSGNYNGGERLIAVAANDKETRSFVFVQMPNGEIFMDGGQPNTRLWLANLQSYYLKQEIMVETKAIKFVDQIVADHPDTLPVSETMVLYRERLLTASGPYDEESRGEPQLFWQLPLSEYENLLLLGAANYTSLDIYSKTYDVEELKSQVTDNWTTENLTLMDTYLQGGTKFVVTDRTGLAYIYELAYKDKYQAYQKETGQKESFALQLYRQELVKYTATEEFTFFKKDALSGRQVSWPIGLPATPVVGQDLPGFDYQTTAFEDFATKFNRYVPGLVSTCSEIIDGKILQKVTKDDVEEVGKIFIPQVAIYKLKDSNHPLYRLNYELKFKGTGLSEDEIVAQNRDLILSMKNYTRSELTAIEMGRKKIELPTLEEYVKEVPILVVIDPWGRLVMLSEGTLITQPICAKELPKEAT